ncbi:MAG TPA: hypothetical protein VGH37_06755 [Candidatus Acidoferrum sp.]
MFKIHLHKRIESSATHSKIHVLAILVLLSGTLAFSGCEKEKTAAAGPPEVEVFEVVQKDVPITREWVATLSGFDNCSN